MLIEDSPAGILYNAPVTDAPCNDSHIERSLVFYLLNPPAEIHRRPRHAGPYSVKQNVWSVYD